MNHIDFLQFQMFIMEELATLGHSYNLTLYEKVKQLLQ